MQNGKSPGPDGFPVEFFKKFSDLLSPLILSVFEESLATQLLPLSMCQAVISLLLKKGKDPLSCSSYCPIQLLNTDAKILTKMLAKQVEEIIPTIVSPDQTGFVKNHQSFLNVRRLFDVLYLCPTW